MSQNIHSGHRERLRRRLEKEGIDSFESHEVLELLLYYSIPRADTNPIAHRLLERFGSLSAVLEAPRSELLKVEGIGQGSATLLSMIPEITRKYMIDKNSKKAVLDSPEKIYEFIKPYFIGCENERLYLICLDMKCKVLNCVLLGEGSNNSVIADVRLICRTALDCGATCVALAHNHSHGFAVPSTNDIMVTKNLTGALKAMSVEVADHIIVTNDDFASMRRMGFFANFDI